MFKDAAIPPNSYTASYKCEYTDNTRIRVPDMISTTDPRAPPPTIPRKPTIKYFPELVMSEAFFYAGIPNKSLMSLADVVTEPKPYLIVAKVPL